MIGGAIGVAILGALMAVGLSASLISAATRANAPITREQAKRMSENPEALVSAAARTEIGPRAVIALQESLASSLRTLFVASAVVVLIAAGFAFALPRRLVGRPVPDAVMAEMATIDPSMNPS